MTSSEKKQPENNTAPTTVGAAFPKTARLLDKKQFDRVFSHASTVSNRHFLILIHHPGDLQAAPGARLGLIVSKKVDKRAVGRNRIKRLVRESFRLQSWLPACDYVVIGRQAARTACNAELLDSLEKLWQQVRYKHTHKRKKS